MSKKLVIVESPTKTKTISKFLGKDYKVLSSFGHIRDLPKSKMGIDIEHDFEPSYVIPTKSRKHATELKKEAKDAEMVYYATDEDREGEAIAWHLHEILKTSPEKTKRISFNEITKDAIVAALEEPREINQDLVEAQTARRVLDRLVGYELSPFLWKKVARGLSAGRVQSVAVRLIVEREREIKNFKPEEYWVLEAVFKTEDGKEFTARLDQLNGKKLDKFDINNEDLAKEVVKELESSSYKVIDLQKKETKKNPMAPFTTSTLQQEANNRLHFSAKKTMMLAQKLYEGSNVKGIDGGLITYMRTDSVNLSKQFVAQARDVLSEKVGKDYIPEKPNFYKAKTKNAQEAHEAIRPTQASLHPTDLKSQLDNDLWKLYNLIWERAMASQMKPALLDATTIDIGGDKTKYSFRANGQVVTFPGWLKIYPLPTKEEILPEVKVDQALEMANLDSQQKFTQPPARYSDATLVKALEEQGIGRPSTYAPTISTVITRGYVERQDRRLAPTDMAMMVTDLLVEHFPNVIDYQFTAKLEDELDDISNGEKDWVPVVKNFYDPFKENLEVKKETISRKDVTSERELGEHPETKEMIKVRIGRFGPYIQLGEGSEDKKPKYAPLPKGVNMDDVTLEQAIEMLRLPRELGKDDEGNEIKANIGRFGPYVQRNKEYRSIPAEEDPLTITLERALELLAQPPSRGKIKEFDSGIEVKKGRYGAYVTDGKINATIPKDVQPEDVTEEQAKELLAAKAAAKPKKKAKKKSE